MTDENTSITWGTTVRFYWTVVWRATALYVVGYAPLVVWLIVGEHLDDPNLILLRFAYALLVMFLAGFIAVRMALRKQYRGFQFQIIREPPS